MKRQLSIINPLRLMQPKIKRLSQLNSNDFWERSLLSSSDDEVVAQIYRLKILCDIDDENMVGEARKISLSLLYNEPNSIRLAVRAIKKKKIGIISAIVLTVFDEFEEMG